MKSDIMLDMFFLIMNNLNIDFQARNLQYKSYTIGDILLTTKEIGLIKEKKFATIALDPKYEAFAIHSAALFLDLDDEMHLTSKA